MVYLIIQELCLYLDEERGGTCRACGAGLRRDDGDGSSSSTNPDDQTPPHPAYHSPGACSSFEILIPILKKSST